MASVRSGAIDVRALGSTHPAVRVQGSGALVDVRDASGTQVFAVDQTGITVGAVLDNPTVTLTDAATIAVDATAGTHFIVTLTASGHTLGKPTGAYDGQTLIITIAQDATGGRTWSLHADYRLPSGLTATGSTSPSVKDKLAVQYDATDSKWDVLGFMVGYA